MEEFNMSNKSEAALAVNNTGFATLANRDFNSIIRENMGGLDFEFEQIKIPAGGATLFEIPGEDDDTENVKEFSGVILYHHPINAYYATKFTGGSNPPDCSSMDGKMGIGKPGGACAVCPLNEYDSGDDERKACQNRVRMYILREGEILPVLFSLPPASVRQFRKFLSKQLTKSRAYYEIVTRFSLEKASSKTGITFSRAVFKLDRILTPEEKPVIAAMSRQIAAYAANVGYEADTGITVDPETGEIIEPLNGGNRNE
jgi:hypothetical protein